MRSLGSVVLGISAYRYAGEVDYAPALKYAITDAEAILKYLRTCWPDGSDAVIRSVDETGADIDAIGKAFAEVAAAGPYDLFLVYLSGHGIRSTPKAGFILQPDATGGLAVATAEELDRLLSSVEAKRTAFILDCCYAEAIIAGMQFFKTLDGSEARLFIGSSRADQLTWEDDEAKHGVFTAHLIDMLNAGDAFRPTVDPDRVQVDAELFPFLCDQVPLYVLDHKGAKQEPVKGGISSSAMTLPTARLARRIRQRTALGTALRRLRQITATGIVCVLVGLGLTYVLVYYTEVDRSGEIVLRNGTRWLEPLFRYLPTLRTRTGIDISMLSADSQSRYPVQSGSLGGVWTHVSEAGYRAWFDQLRGLIEPRARESLDALIQNKTNQQIRGDPKDARPSDIETAAGTMLTAPDEATIAWALAGVPSGDRLKPIVSDFDPNNLDFTVLDLNPGQISSYAKALKDCARIDPDRTLPVYVGFLKAAQEWLHASNDLKRRVDLMERAVDEIASVLPVIALAMKDRGKSVFDEQTSKALLELAKRGYFETAGGALARAPGLNGTTRASLVELVLSRFKGDLNDPAQLEALHVLTWMLDGSASAKDMVGRVTATFQNSGSSQNTYLTKFWIDAADVRSLPASVVDDLVEKARAGVARTELEFFDNEVARVLAHAIADVPNDHRDVVYSLIDRVGASITPMSGTMAEIYGSLGRVGLDRPGMLEKVTTQLSAGLSRRSEAATNDDDKLPAMEITVGGTGPWAWALAAFGQHRMLSAEATDLLRRVAPVVQFKDDVEAAIAHQADFTGQCKDTLCIAPLTHSPTDSRFRDLGSDLLAISIARLPREKFEAAIAELGERRKVEVEPEARIALGQAIAGSISRRYLPMGVNKDVSP
jgi:Caspase domain